MGPIIVLALPVSVKVYPVTCELPGGMGLSGSIGISLYVNVLLTPLEIVVNVCLTLKLSGLFAAFTVTGAAINSAANSIAAARSAHFPLALVLLFIYINLAYLNSLNGPPRRLVFYFSSTL
jgi:hypothetical protein